MANRDFRIDLVLRALTAQARGELQKAERSIKGVHDAAGRLSKVDAGAAMRGLGTAAVAAGAVAVAVMGKYIANTIEAEKVQAQLNARIKDTGGVARRSLDQLNAQADKLQSLTIFDDEAIGSAQAMLLTFKQIRDVNFDRAIEASTDLSTVLGVDLSAAAKLVGRALEDPERGLLALTRAGVSFTEGEREKIKAMVEAGRVADAQTLILNKLEGTMGSAAEAARNTLGGALQALRNSFDNLLEGDAGDAGVVGVRNAVEDLIELLNDPATKQGFDNLVAGAVSAVREMVRLVTTTANVTRFIGEEIAARAGGPAATDTVRVQERIERLQKTMAAVQKARGTVGLSLLNASELVPDDLISRPETVIKRLQGELDKEQNKLRVGMELNEESARRAAEIAKAAAAGGGAGGGSVDPDIEVTKKAKGSKADPEAAAKRRLAALQEEVTLLGQLKDGEDKASEAAKIRYAVTEGEFKNVSPALKQQLLDQADLLDQKREDVEAEKERKKAIEESREAYEDLKDSLRTPAEAALDQAIEQVRILNAAAQQGTAEYDRLLARIATGLVAEQPDFEGLAPEVGGPFGELTKLEEAADREEKWYQDSLARLAQFRAARAENIAAANAAEQQLEVQHQDRLRQIEAARQQAQIVAASATFGALADMAKSFAGEQSQTYKVLFAISKGFAVAQAAVALAQNVAEASKIGFPQNLPMIAGAFAQGAQIVSLLSAATYSGAQGYATGGRIRGSGTGTSDSIPIMASDGEFMTRAAVVRQPGALDFLEDFNERGMAALSGWTGYADGGLVAERPALPSPDWASHPQGAGGLAASVTNRLAVMNYLDPDDLADALSRSSRFSKHVVNTVIGDGGTIRAGWQA